VEKNEADEEKNEDLEVCERGDDDDESEKSNGAESFFGEKSLVVAA